MLGTIADGMEKGERERGVKTGPQCNPIFIKI